MGEGLLSTFLHLIYFFNIVPWKHRLIVLFRVALTIIFADEKKEEKISFILYTFVKFALVTEQKLNIEEYSISSVNPVPFQA